MKSGNSDKILFCSKCADHPSHANGEPDGVGPFAQCAGFYNCNQCMTTKMRPKKSGAVRRRKGWVGADQEKMVIVPPQLKTSMANGKKL